MRTLCWDCMFGLEKRCPVTSVVRCDNSRCSATDEQLAAAAAQIATLQHERAIERLPEQQRAQARQHAADAFGGEVEA